MDRTTSLSFPPSLSPLVTSIKTLLSWSGAAKEEKKCQITLQLTTYLRTCRWKDNLKPQNCLSVITWKPVFWSLESIHFTFFHRKPFSRKHSVSVSLWRQWVWCSAQCSGGGCADDTRLLALLNPTKQHHQRPIRRSCAGPRRSKPQGRSLSAKPLFMLIYTNRNRCTERLHFEGKCGWFWAEVTRLVLTRSQIWNTSIKKIQIQERIDRILSEGGYYLNWNIKLSHQAQLKLISSFEVKAGHFISAQTENLFPAHFTCSHIVQEFWSENDICSQKYSVC